MARSEARTNDPALTRAWLTRPKPAPEPKQFIAQLGYVRYSTWMQRGKTNQRWLYLNGATCEICQAVQGSAVLVFDHCHRHGWVRAVLCNSHNVRIAHLEAAWLEYGIDLTATPYWTVLMNCQGCA